MIEHTLEQLVIELGNQLQQRGWFLVTAESCTGGWIAQAVTAIPGSSSWFERGFVTYSNVSKQEMLGIPQETLEHYGAVSEQTVVAMVNGALAHSHAQVGIAVSGIAGPSGGTVDKPVGTVWVAYAFPHGISTICYHLSGDRHAIRYQTVYSALETLLKLIQ